MIDKTRTHAEDAIAAIPEGATIMIGGFGECGRPDMLLHLLLESGRHNLTIVSNNAGEGRKGLAALLLARRIGRMICSFPRGAMAKEVEMLVREGSLTLEVMPQGTLAERMRAAAAGIPAFYCPTGVGTMLADGRETRMFNGRPCLLETALTADVALIKAHRADRWGNLTYDRMARNFSPLMCGAATRVIAEADEIVPLGGIVPEQVATQGVFVETVVRSRPVPAELWERALA